MRKYELVCLIQPDLDEAAVTGIVDRIKGWVTDSGGSIDKVDMWGKHRLAYMIRKQRESTYVLFNVSMLPTATSSRPALSGAGPDGEHAVCGTPQRGVSLVSASSVMP